MREMVVRDTRFAHYGRSTCVPWGLRWLRGCACGFARRGPLGAKAGAVCSQSFFRFASLGCGAGAGQLLRLGLVQVFASRRCLAGSAWAVRSALFAVSGSSMFASFSRVGFCGSRSLPASAQPLVASVVSAVLSGSSARLAVGCSVGADSLVLSSVPVASFPRVSVFAAFGSGGRGACSLSAVSSVLAAARAGASVAWWAGGRLGVPLRLRLAGRSVALVRFLAHLPASQAGSRPSALVCFLASRKSRGSLLACRLAARLGVSVFVFCVGFSPAQLPRLGRGSWCVVQVAGYTAFQWQPESLKKQLCEFYESITWMEYSPRLRKRVRQLRPEVLDLLTIAVVLLAVIVGIIASIINPNPVTPLPSAPHPAEVSEDVLQHGIQGNKTKYDELLLPFSSEQEAHACLQWLNETSESRLWQALSRARITSARRQIIVTKRPYTTWKDVYDLPKVGIKTIEQIITAWRNAQ